MDSNLTNLNTDKIETAMIVAAASKTTPVDADLLPLVDSAASNTLKKLTWANLKAAITGSFATLTGTETLTNKTLTSPIINGTGLNFTDSSVQKTAATGFGFKNRIINGDMRIDQRNAGASVTPSDGQYCLDRYRAGASAASKFSVQQSSVAPAGFSKSMLITSLSAYSLSAGDNFEMFHYIEAFNTADFGWGTANAQAVTLSFWTRSSLTGTFGGSAINNNWNRSYPFAYTINAANTWELKTITIPGDTSGTWEGATNAAGIRLSFGIGVGTTKSGTAGAWASAEYYSATGATSVVGTSGATFYITGVQLEKGSTATSFDYRPYGTELALCQRYYYRTVASNAFSVFMSGVVESATSIYGCSMALPVTMRSTPTLNYSGIRAYEGTNLAAITSINNTTMASPGILAVGFGASGGGLVVGRYGLIQANNSTSAYVDASAEL